MPNETLSELEKFETTRLAFEITRARLSNYKDLWAETEQKGDQRFIQETRKLWKELAVHGVWGWNKKEGKFTILNFTDLDGRCCLGLLKIAGINTQNVEYIPPGTYVKGKINFDTGNRWGLVVEDGGRTAIIDHHNEGTSSATEFTYKILVRLGLLKKEEYLDKLVEFVTQVDNKTYPVKNFFQKSWRTVLGLQRFLQFKPLLKYFRSGHSPDEILSDEELQKLGIKERSYEQATVVERSLAQLKRMENEGLIISSDRYGRIAVDIGKKVKAGADAAEAYGCGVYIIWNPEGKSFFLTTIKPFILTDEFIQGIKVRETMWIKPEHDLNPLTITLGEILNKMTDGKLQATGKLKECLEREAVSKSSP